MSSSIETAPTASSPMTALKMARRKMSDTSTLKQCSRCSRVTSSITTVTPCDDYYLRTGVCDECYHELNFAGLLGKPTPQPQTYASTTTGDDPTTEAVAAERQGCALVALLTELSEEEMSAPGDYQEGFYAACERIHEGICARARGEGAGE